jgi:hypothetical protein
VPVFDAWGRAVAAVEVELVGRAPEAVELTLPTLLTAARCLRRELVPAELRRRPVLPAPVPARAAEPVRLQA